MSRCHSFRRRNEDFRWKTAKNWTENFLWWPLDAYWLLSVAQKNRNTAKKNLGANLRDVSWKRESLVYLLGPISNTPRRKNKCDCALRNRLELLAGFSSVLQQWKTKHLIRYFSEKNVFIMTNKMTKRSFNNPARSFDFNLLYPRMSCMLWPRLLPCKCKISFKQATGNNQIRKCIFLNIVVSQILTVREHIS